MLDSIREQLQSIFDDIVVGESLSPSLPPRLERSAKSILYRHNIKQAHIQVEHQGEGYAVLIVVPPQGAIAKTVRLTLSCPQ